MPTPHQTPASKLAYVVHGRGRGHANRARSCVPALRAAGHEVTVFAGGDAVDLLADLGGREDWQSTLPGRGMLRRTWAQSKQAEPRLRALGPDAIITDGDLPALLLARRLGVPSVALGHSLVFTACRMPRGIDRAAVLYEHLNTLGPTRLATERVAVHFLPIEPRLPRTRVARPDLTVPTGVETEPRRLVCYFRDRNGAPWLEAAARSGFEVICFGGLDRVPGGVEHRPFDRADFLNTLASATAVMASAGSNLIAEALMLRKPLLALHPPREFEPRLNARLLAEGDLGMAGVLTSPPGDLPTRFLERVAAGGFRTLDLEHAVPPVSEVLVAAVGSALSGG
jgi:UDP-N-acetylglucosamine--N-acetylmuramyl-(pentapeptide) pyrophosphoryl-undecaprenol N-acetylglucosamine transferase